MKQSEYDDFTSILQVVSEQYGKALSGNVIALYWQALKDYDLDAVRDALGRHLRNTDAGQFMPKIADIVRMMQGSTQDGALRAWAKVDKAVRQVGPYQSVVFDDALIHRVVYEMGGWQKLCSGSGEEWPFIAKEFENRYRGYKIRGDRFEYPARLIGIAEAKNSETGKQIDPPVLVGNQQMALEVMNGGGDASKLLSMAMMPIQTLVCSRPDMVNRATQDWEKK